MEAHMPLLADEILGQNTEHPPTPHIHSLKPYSNLSLSSSGTCHGGDCESSITKALWKGSQARDSQFQVKSPGWLSQGAISSEPFVPAGQRVGSWSRGCESMEGTRKEWFYQGYPYYCISSSQCKAFRKHWVIKVKCQSHSRILSHLIEALSVAVSVYFLISWHLFSI